MPRSAHALAILGPALYSQLRTTRVLVVGAGGIGCELLKNIILTGFEDITLLDLDTIDLSNLNRQFLFRKKDVKQSKAMVAARTASSFNPACKITPIYANIKEEDFDISWFKGFQLVLNALDNLEARRHVNRMCMAAKVPLIESGTAGYLGQVQPLLKDETECFDCLPKPTPKTFPVCTIRSTPSTPIHCIVWAKSYLFPQLFGEQDDSGEAELDAAAAQGENATEIANLRKEAAAFSVVRASLFSEDSELHAAEMIFQKIFNEDIKRLLSMSDMWKTRRPPVPLDYQSILADTFSVSSKSPGTTNGSAGSTVLGKRKAPHADAVSNGEQKSENFEQQSGAGGLRDQKQLGLKDNVLLFGDSLNRLAARMKSGKEPSLSFDKDDDDTLDFVTATANLRAFAYGIVGKTRWQVKEMAGNIIPAIATTNAVISGLIVLQALHMLRLQHQDTASPPAFTAASATTASSNPLAAKTLRNVHLTNGKPAVPLGSYFTCPPNPDCAVCRETYVEVLCDPEQLTLGALVDAVLEAEAAPGASDSAPETNGESVDGGEKAKREVTIYEEGRILADPDWDENLSRTLADLKCGRGKFVTLADEDEVLGNLVLCIGLLPPNHIVTDKPYILPAHIPRPPARPPKPRAPTPPPVASKRVVPEPEDDSALEEPAAKRTKVSNDTNGSLGKAALFKEENGVLLINDDEDDDIIML